MQIHSASNSSSIQPTQSHPSSDDQQQGAIKSTREANPILTSHNPLVQQAASNLHQSQISYSSHEVSQTASVLHQVRSSDPDNGSGVSHQMQISHSEREASQAANVLHQMQISSPDNETKQAANILYQIQTS